ncbi:MAG: hypothetical protein MJK04_07160, partial [Psychrosphaera sp.]|nr:hypothetical protein [Psychrosphaera sp.]
GAAYSVGDKITFTFPNGALTNFAFASVIQMTAINSAVESQAIAGLTMGLLNSDSTSVTYRVTTLRLPNDGATTPIEWQNGSTLGGSFTLGRINYTAASLAISNVTVTVSSQTAGGDILDSAGTRIATVAETRSQFGTASVTQQFDAIVDVSRSLNLFTPNAADTFSWSVTNPDTTGWLNRATVNNTTMDLYGTPGKFTGLTIANFTAGGTLTFIALEAKMNVAFIGEQTTDTLTFTAAGDALLQAQNFNSDIKYTYTSAAFVAGTKTITTGINAGAWSATNHSLVTLSANTTAINEAAGVSTITASMSNISFEDVTVGLSYSGTATGSVDYNPPAASIVITAGQTQGSTTLTAIDDTTLEAGETIVVDVTSVTGGSVTENGNQQQTINITDNDTTNVSLSVDNTTIAETGGSSSIIATLTQATYENVTVNLALTGSATTNDLTLSTGAITIAAGQTVGSITLSANNDTLVEGTETVIIDVASVSGGNAIESGTQQQSVNIIDDDYSPVSVSLSVSANSMAEVTATNTITATLDTATLKDVTVSLGYSGTATNGTDYTSQSSTIVIAAGQTTNTTTLTIMPDTDIEADETIIVDITGVTGANASENGT